ncbi:hypothetical protein BOTCAL_0156g00170 [Botryotinia calthae]|uniref:Uncharacterized protein n=1 Tax=Botryotinia calthae TaxID=38488 RepID=A0A4Y8D484_9HELO|nr:hypothetical protein BOTCAL_0156g00170 [Botryotinia calthae]
MGILYSRFGLETNILCQKATDLVHKVGEQDPEMAQLIEQCLTTLRDKDISEIEFKKMLKRINPNPSSLQKKGCNDSSEFISLFDKQKLVVHELINEQRENASNFWKDVDCSTGCTSTSISQLWKCIDDENKHKLNPTRRCISLVLLFRLQEKIKARIKTRVDCIEGKLPDAVNHVSLTTATIIENILTEDPKPILERRSALKNLREILRRRMTIARRYASLGDGMLLMLVFANFNLSDSCTNKQFEEIQEHLAQSQFEPEVSIFEGDLKKALLDVEAFTDLELDKFIKSTDFPYDDGYSEAIRILFCSEINEPNPDKHIVESNRGYYKVCTIPATICATRIANEDAEPDTHLSQKLSEITGVEQGGAIGNTILGTDVTAIFVETTFSLFNIKPYIGAYIFENLQPKKRRGSFTEAINLHFPNRPG